MIEVGEQTSQPREIGIEPRYYRRSSDRLAGGISCEEEEAVMGEPPRRRRGVQRESTTSNPTASPSKPQSIGHYCERHSLCPT